MQGAAGNVIVLQPTKTAMTFCDIDPGRWIDVPAFLQLICFPSNLHVTGFSSCRITSMIHSYLVCVCVCVCTIHIKAWGLSLGAGERWGTRGLAGWLAEEGGWSWAGLAN